MEANTTKFKPYSLVVAVSANNGVGLKGKLPWPYIPRDMKHFVRMTSTSQIKNTILMGRKTWESIPLERRPLKNRFNVVITRSTQIEPIAGQLV